MARENDVRLFGEIIEKNIIEGDNYLSLKVLRRNRDREDIILVKARSLDQFNLVHVGDFVDIQGIFTTEEKRKEVICSECGEKVPDFSFFSYITPLFLMKYPTPVDLREFKEISNRVYLMGLVSGKVNALTVETGDSSFDTTRYRLSVRRKVRIPEADQDTDKPFVSSFGEQAVNDSLKLQDGTLVFINGSLQTRTIFVKHRCKQCQSFTQTEKTIMEVVPQGVEYLKDFKSWDSFDTPHS